MMRIPLFLTFLFLMFSTVYAKSPIGRVILVRGNVQKQLAGAQKFTKVKKGDVVLNKTKYKTMERSVLKIKLNDNSQFLLSPNSETIVTHFSKGNFNIINMIGGKVRSYVEKSQEAKKHKVIVQSNKVALGVRGTEFLFSISEKSKNVQAVTFEGTVDFTKINKGGVSDILKSLSNNSIKISPGQRSVFNLASNTLGAPTMLPKGLFLKLAKLNPFSTKTNYEKEFSASEKSSKSSNNEPNKKDEPLKEKKPKEKEENKEKKEVSESQDKKEEKQSNKNKDKTKKWYTKLSSTIVSKTHEFNQDQTQIRDKLEGTGILLAIDLKRTFGRFFDAHIGLGRLLLGYDGPNNVQHNGDPPGNYAFFNLGFSVNFTKNFSIIFDRKSEGEVGFRFNTNSSQGLDLVHIGMGKSFIGFRYKLFTLFDLPIHVQYQKLNMDSEQEYEGINYTDGSGVRVGLTTIGTNSTGFNFSFFTQSEEQNSNINTTNTVREERKKTSFEIAYIF